MRGSLPAPEAAALGVQMCSGLAAAHAAGLVHRDVKPQNLLLGTDGVLKLGDFGVAVGREGTRLTLAGTVLGTVGYLAPEQARGEQVTAAADIYAVGAVLYELLGGEPFRTAGSLAELGLEERPPDLAARVPRAPADLVLAVTSCLSAKPEGRPESAATLARLLASLADPEERATEVLPRAVRRGRRGLRRRLGVAAALVAAAVAGLAAAVALSTGSHALPVRPRCRAMSLRRPPERASPSRPATSPRGCATTRAERATRAGSSRSCDDRRAMSAIVELHDHAEDEDPPAWSLPAEAVDRIRVPVTLPDQVTREWAWGGSTGAGVRVCILDSGIEFDHPLVGRVDHSVAVLRDDDDELQVVEDAEGDLCGHGTACAGVVRALAPMSS